MTDRIEAILTKLENSRANGDPEKYIAPLSVADAHYLARYVRSAALASPPMPGRGEGFVLVPVEATEAMKLAGLESLDWHLAPEGSEHDAAAINNSYLSTVSDVYRAMLAASPLKEDTHAE